MNGEVVNAHLKIIENGDTRYKNLSTLNINQFQTRIQQIASSLSSLRPINPDTEAVLITEHGKELFQKLMTGSLTITYKGRKQYLDFDFGVILDELQNFAENPFDFISVGKAQDITKAADFRFGFTLDGEPVFPLKNQVNSWGIRLSDMRHDSENPFEFLRHTTFGRAVYDLTSIIGIILNSSQKSKKEDSLRNVVSYDDLDRKRGLARFPEILTEKSDLLSVFAVVFLS